MTQPTQRREIPKAYDFASAEQRIYKLWMESGHFTPKIDWSKKPFVIIMPPPNVTGQLHMGHALTIALEDLMTRWHRMKGDPTLYLPGTDHAGIATQVVVEREIKKDGLTRHDLGREKFVKRVWEWVDQYGGRIYEQTKRLAASCDWSRAAFTLDEGPSKAVRTTFVNLYNKGLIYRGERIVNWCPKCMTALSDLEVEHKEEDGKLYQIRYKMEDGSGEIIVATTRPETLLGDTAVAVNPNDERFTKFIGKNAVLPVLGRLIPVIADEAVDMAFGTGGLKVTPAHDPNDFLIGERHKLPIVNVMNLDGTMNENAGPYRGKDRFVTRKEIVEQLEREELLVKIEPHRHAVGHCGRSGDVLEPLISKQWYMRMKPLAKPAIEAVRDGRVTIVPDRFSKVYFNWMDNIQDWCVSRQLWWGHRIPVWYCAKCGGETVSVTDPTMCSKCGSSQIERDPDVLDTWFSSALWPHSTLGWPEKTDDLKYFYPSTVMETGWDILFFWVARMMMMGIENAGDIPFRTIYLHGLVLDPEGAKMSKSKGNAHDPLEIIDLYGADALRFALTTGNSPGNNMRLNESKIESSRNFANKLWNASRYVMTNLEKGGSPDNWQWPPTPSHLEDRWIMSRLNRVTLQVEKCMAEFQFGEAQRELYDFMWSEYCDWYLEMSKVRLRAGDNAPLPFLAYVLEKILRLLHPFMPFITEEVWQSVVTYMPRSFEKPELLMVAEYPIADTSLLDDRAEAEIGAIIDLVRAIRNLRAEFRIQQTQPVEAIVAAPDLRQVIEAEADAIKTLATSDPVRTVDGAAPSTKDSVVLVLPKGTVTIPLGGLVDIAKEIQRLLKELEQLDKLSAGLSARLNNPEFTSKAPEDVIERERERLATMEDRRARVKETLERLG
ncbi:MAG: valine--tRNA ligase [SAR202 cluster bacterium]|nr:valine--tRNA ligase [SAR202 cluster bacterium]